MTNYWTERSLYRTSFVTPRFWQRYCKVSCDIISLIKVLMSHKNSSKVVPWLPWGTLFRYFFKTFNIKTTIPEVGVAGEALRIYSYSIYLDIPNDNTPINTRGHKLSGTCFSSTVDLHLTGERTGQYHLLLLFLSKDHAGEAGVSFKAGHQVNLMAVSMILPDWFDHLGKVFLIKKLSSNISPACEYQPSSC